MNEIEALSKFDKMLEENFPSITVAGHEYTPFHALKLLDETTYEIEFKEWLESEGIDLDG